ncbi:hypothetical protein BJ944DRAFT_268023, partial [Cunninghamella echinulata]
GDILTNDNSSIWDVYFLLTVNTVYINTCIQQLSEEQLLFKKTNINLLFNACLEKMTSTTVSSSTSIEQTRQNNAIIILSCLLRALFSKKRLSQFNVIDILTGLDKADTLFGKLISSLDNLLNQPTTKSVTLTLAITLSAGSDNVNQNSFNGYFMHHDLSPVLFQIITDDSSSEKEIQNAFMLFAMLSNYNKYETRNPYLKYLSQCKQDRFMQYRQLKEEDESLTKSVATYMSGWFSGSSTITAVDIDNPQSLIDFPPAGSSLLLLLYDLINTNPYFINTIIKSTLAKESSVRTFLPTLLSFTSYLFQHNRNDRSFVYTKLILLILLRLCEEPNFLNGLNDQDAEFTVRLCRQRPPPLPKAKKPRSLLCAMLDDIILFLKHNMRKKLDMATYKLSFSLMHRILSFLYKRRVRLAYHWNELWPTLTSVLHFTVIHLNELKPRADEFNDYLASFIRIFNICITHGETFLLDTKSFDTLFYEIIRASDDFMALSHYATEKSLMGRKGQMSTGDRSPPLSINDFSNIKTICHHFKPALDEWQEAQHVKYPSPDQVMALIQEHFVSLSLAPMDKLVHFTPYNEIPNEMGYFRYVLRIVVSDYLNKVLLGN